MSIGRRYSIFGQRAVAASAPQTALGITSGGANLKKPSVYDMTFGSTGTPTDAALLYQTQRSTATGTGTTTTAPTALDPGDTSPDTTSAQNHTADPTYTANSTVHYLPLNQRASHRWISDPLGPLVVAAVSNNGLGTIISHASFTGNASVLMHFFE